MIWKVTVPTQMLRFIVVGIHADTKHIKHPANNVPGQISKFTSAVYVQQLEFKDDNMQMKSTLICLNNLQTVTVSAKRVSYQSRECMGWEQLHHFGNHLQTLTQVPLPLGLLL